jgi:hypothetical protein
MLADAIERDPWICDVKRNPRSKILFPFLALLPALSACTAPKPLPVPVPPKVAFSTLIVSDPTSVRCNVSGKSGTAMTITTPRLIPISKLGAPITIRCFSPGYWTEQVTILAGSKKPLLTRVINREQITPDNAPVRGKSVGPGGEFPREVTVTLRRDAFESTAARDAYYAEHLHRVAERWSRLIAQARTECEDGVVSQKGRSAVALPELCREGFRRLDVMKEGELQLVEQQRRRSGIP